VVLECFPTASPGSPMLCINFFVETAYIKSHFLKKAKLQSIRFGRPFSENVSNISISLARLCAPSHIAFAVTAIDCFHLLRNFKSLCDGALIETEFKCNLQYGIINVTTTGECHALYHCRCAHCFVAAWFGVVLYPRRLYPYFAGCCGSDDPDTAYQRSIGLVGQQPLKNERTVNHSIARFNVPAVFVEINVLNTRQATS
jgi:hypothetical protein